ncbi:hypothetical protein T06_12884 [Trichinella sp. T6]|nr:hypothetical protein T06_12884 [Trichinella sp. T6]
MPLNGVDLAQLVKRVGHGDEDGHARAEEAHECAILKRVAIMKTELRRVSTCEFGQNIMKTWL